MAKQARAKALTASALMVRLDPESKHALAAAAELQRISVGDYVRTVTEDGRAVTGLVVHRTNEAVSIVDATGKRTDLAAATIDELESLPTSLMPEQLLRDLTAGQAADLLAYLGSLRA